jgi:hypothetical protein
MLFFNNLYDWALAISFGINKIDFFCKNVFLLMIPESSHQKFFRISNSAVFSVHALQKLHHQTSNSFACGGMVFVRCTWHEIVISCLREQNQIGALTALSGSTCHECMCAPAPPCVYI